MNATQLLRIDLDSQVSPVPKFRRVVDAVKAAISEGRLAVGDPLPSVNQMCSDYQLSRDTIFKAYSLLKEQGVIDSVPNKGYFVADQLKKVFVFLDTFKAYKEVLYDAFVHALPKNIIADVNFHHYNARIFRKLIEDSLGRYSKYIIMPFGEHGVEDALRLIPREKLLVIDWNLYANDTDNVLYQDFGASLETGLDDVLHLLRKYSKVHFLYPEYTNHPHESVEHFERFCRNHGMDYTIETDSQHFDVHAGIAYISVSDRMLGRLLEQCRAKKLELGKDVGVISYNETPMKKFIMGGITVFSTDFRQMGLAAAQFVTSDEKMRQCVPSRIIIRDSL